MKTRIYATPAVTGLIFDMFELHSERLVMDCNGVYLSRIHCIKSIFKF